MAKKKKKIIPKKTEDNLTSSNRLLKYFAATLTIIGIILGIITDGFQVWDNFSKEDKKEIINPIIDFRIEDYRYKIGDDSEIRDGNINFSIQSSNGVYKILDSIKLSNFKIIEKDYFAEYSYSTPNVYLKEVILDRRILDSKTPDQLGLLNFENDFILNGSTLGNLIMNKGEETIAKFTIEIPYLFDSKIYKFKKEVPIIVYYN